MTCPDPFSDADGQGNAAINPDCTFALVITDSTGLVVHEWGAITGEGRSQEFHAIVTDPGWVFVESVK